MRIGTKSVLFGAHQFLIHPWFVAAGWWRLYGFPWDLRLWVAFFVHDLGYIGKPNMDGPEGERHPYWGATFMYGWFDGSGLFGFTRTICNRLWGNKGPMYWHDLVLYHSRYLSKQLGEQPSQLCIADKLAIALTPPWIYLPLTRLTGEIHEYMRDALRAHPDMPLDLSSQVRWYASVRDYCRRWVAEHKDGRADEWTSARRETVDESGTWR